MGINTDLPYDVKRSVIPANHRLLLYTDGLAEAFPEGGDQHDEFGTDGIVGALKAAVELPLDQALDTLFIASHDFTGGTGRHDDTSVVLLERQG